MRVLVTGATGYVGGQLIPRLWAAGHEIVALVRNKANLKVTPLIARDLQVVEGDLLTGEGLGNIPKDIDGAYYLVHSMKHKSQGFFELEAQAANNFVRFIDSSSAKQVIYISGLSPKQHLSEHMASRQNVETILEQSCVALTVFRAGIVIGEGSISFEIMRDIVGVLPVMITPKWVESKCQPIGIKDMLTYLEKALGFSECMHKKFEIGGSDILTYKEMLKEFARYRGIKRYILSLPVLTPYLSSLWLCFVTSANYSIAKALVQSLTVDAVCDHDRINDVIPLEVMGFTQSLECTFKKIAQNPLADSWEEAVVKREQIGVECIQVPKFGVKKMTVIFEGKENHLTLIKKSPQIFNMFRVGEQGLVSEHEVLLDDQSTDNLILYKRVGMLGEVWLQWEYIANSRVGALTFRPIGTFGRLWWCLSYLYIKQKWFFYNKTLEQV